MGNIKKKEREDGERERERATRDLSDPSDDYKFSEEIVVGEGEEEREGDGEGEGGEGERGEREDGFWVSVLVYTEAVAEKGEPILIGSSSLSLTFTHTRLHFLLSFF